MMNRGRLRRDFEAVFFNLGGCVYISPAWIVERNGLTMLIINEILYLEI